jgi:DnaJ-class molecular chaperone
MKSLFLLCSYVAAQWQNPSKTYQRDQRLYDVLEIPRHQATPELIKSQFKKLAIRYHPDKNRDDPTQAKLLF